MMRLSKSLTTLAVFQVVIHQTEAIAVPNIDISRRAFIPHYNTSISNDQLSTGKKTITLTSSEYNLVSSSVSPISTAHNTTLHTTKSKGYHTSKTYHAIATSSNHHNSTKPFRSHVKDLKRIKGLVSVFSGENSNKTHIGVTEHKKHNSTNKHKKIKHHNTTSSHPLATGHQSLNNPQKVKGVVFPLSNGTTEGHYKNQSGTLFNSKPSSFHNLSTEKKLPNAINVSLTSHQKVVNVPLKTNNFTSLFGNNSLPKTKLNNLIKQIKDNGIQHLNMTNSNLSQAVSLAQKKILHSSSLGSSATSSSISTTVDSSASSMITTTSSKSRHRRTVTVTGSTRFRTVTANATA